MSECCFYGHLDTVSRFELCRSQLSQQCVPVRIRGFEALPNWGEIRTRVPALQTRAIELLSEIDALGSHERENLGVIENMSTNWILLRLRRCIMKQGKCRARKPALMRSLSSTT